MRESESVFSRALRNERTSKCLPSDDMLWQDGSLCEIGGCGPRAVDTTLHHVPALFVCTMANGTAGVFPGDASTCQTLGLSEPKPSVVAPSK